MEAIHLHKVVEKDDEIFKDKIVQPGNEGMEGA